MSNPDREKLLERAKMDATQNFVKLLNSAFGDRKLEIALNNTVAKACNDSSHKILSFIYGQMETKMGILFEDKVMNQAIMNSLITLLKQNGSGLNKQVRLFFEKTPIQQNQNRLKNTHVFHFLNNFPQFIQKNNCKGNPVVQNGGGSPVRPTNGGVATLTLPEFVQQNATNATDTLNNIKNASEPFSSDTSETAIQTGSASNIDYQIEIRDELLRLISSLKTEIGTHLIKSVETSFQSATSEFVKKVDLNINHFFGGIITNISKSELFANDILISVYFYQFLKHIQNSKENSMWIDDFNKAISDAIAYVPQNTPSAFQLHQIKANAMAQIKNIPTKVPIQGGPIRGGKITRRSRLIPRNTMRRNKKRKTNKKRTHTK